MLHIIIGELYPGGCQVIDSWRGELCCTVKSNVIPSPVVIENENNVGIRSWSTGCQWCHRYECEETGSWHDPRERVGSRFLKQMVKSMVDFEGTFHFLQKSSSREFYVLYIPAVALLVTLDFTWNLIFVTILSNLFKWLVPWITWAGRI